MRTFRRPIIPGYQFGGSGLAAMALLAVAPSSKSHAQGAPRQLSAEEITERDKRAERKRWNDEVAERKAAKRLVKRGYAK